MCSCLWWKASRSTSSSSAYIPHPTPNSHHTDLVRSADILLLEPNPRWDRRFRTETIPLENSRRTYQHRYAFLPHSSLSRAALTVGCRFPAVIAFGGTDTVQGCSVPLYEHVREGFAGTHHLAILEMAYQEGRFKRYAFRPSPEPTLIFYAG